LSNYYTHLAEAYSGLKDTARAVDAACGAIVSWGPRHDQRASALHSLYEVLSKAEDLEVYVKALNRDVDETGLDNALVRKALGQVFSERNRHAEAITHLRLACELQPNDAETHQQLMNCYDAIGDDREAVAQRLRSLEYSRRRIEQYEDLAQRFERLGKPDEAERAVTSIVEALPNESEGHTLIAEIRQRQDRWPEAAQHWKEVARIRELEPNGLLKLAAAQVHMQNWTAAGETLGKLQARAWPERFRNTADQIRNLQRQIDAGRVRE
jgi:tetratricopeptide (TPR) repeat protein